MSPFALLHLQKLPLLSVLNAYVHSNRRSPARTRTSRGHVVDLHVRRHHAQDAVHELAQRRELLSLYQPKRGCEVDEVLEQSVEMRLGSQGADLGKVRVVYVRVHAKQPGEDLPDDVREVPREVRALRLRK